MVRKEIVRVGDQQPSLVSNTKVSLYACLQHCNVINQAVFHFRTFRLGADGESTELLDDTREIGNGPFELIIGRSFKLKIWEELIRGMWLNEVAKFTCEPEVSNGAS